jgi:Uma2 family endonuclease
VTAKIDDYLAFGVENIWVVDPPRHRVSVHTRTGSLPCTDKVETTDGEISISLEDIFGHMPPVAEE